MEREGLMKEMDLEPGFEGWRRKAGRVLMCRAPASLEKGQQSMAFPSDH